MFAGQKNKTKQEPLKLITWQIILTLSDKILFVEIKC